MLAARQLLRVAALVGRGAGNILLGTHNPIICAAIVPRTARSMAGIKFISIERVLLLELNSKIGVIGIEHQILSRFGKVVTDL